MSTIPDTVIIGNHTQGLGILRSAAEIGSRVFVVNDKHISITRFSKYLYAYKRLPRGTLASLSNTTESALLLKSLLSLNVKKRRTVAWRE